MNKLVVKLSALFIIVLIIFSMVIGSVFYILFKEYSMTIHKEELLNYAIGLINEDCKTSSMHQQHHSYSSIRFLNDVADIDVWVIDSAYNVMKFGKNNKMGAPLPVKELPDHANEIIEQVFHGQTIYSENFSEAMDSQTLTLGLPISYDDNNVDGVLLLHTPVEGIEKALSSGYKILIVSLIVALLLSIIISIIVSYYFIKPLLKMKATTYELSKGNYASRSHIHQKDELGDLASSIDELAHRLEEASEESEQLERLRKEFMANVSHELRTPITVMRGSLEALDDGLIDSPEKVKAYHHQMLKESKYLERLVGDLLEITKLENPDFKIEKRQVFIQEILNDVVRSAQVIGRQRNITIDLKLEKIPLAIEGDYGRLRQMFWIVVDNGLKFSPDNSLLKIDLTKTTLIISDQGVGIEEDQLSHIFDRFYKVKNEQNKSGSGLGLSIAKGIAQRHDIDLEVKNNSDHGISVIFNFNDTI